MKDRARITLAMKKQISVPSNGEINIQKYAQVNRALLRKSSDTCDIFFSISSSNSDLLDSISKKVKQSWF